MQVPTSIQPDLNEVTFQTALSQLASNQSLFLQLTGYITFKGKSTPIVSNLSWSTSTTGTKALDQLEIQESVNGALVRRIVGDGDTLWNYDLVAHQYSATSYGGYGATRPDSYLADLLNDVNWSATGQTSYLAKLLRQIYNSSGLYISWMPGVRSINLPQNVPVADPVNQNQVYSPTATDWFYLYDGSPKRTIAFEIVPQTQSNGLPPIDVLKTINLNQVDQVGRLLRYTQWQITPYTGVTFSTNIFLPYTGTQIQGWRPIVGPKPVTN